MAEHLLASAAFGLAALDLLGPLVLVLLLARGAPARRTTALVLSVVAAAGVLGGTLLALLGRPLVDRVVLRVGAAGTGATTVTLLVIAGLLALWAGVRVARGHPQVRVPDVLTALLTGPDGGPATPRSAPGTGTVLAVALAVGLAPLGDLAFLGAVGIGATRDSAVEAVAGLSVAVAIGQAPLFAFGAAVLAGGKAAVARGREALTGAGSSARAGRLVTAAVAVSALAFVALALAHA